MRALIGAWALAAMGAAPLGAQDLFEVQIFPDENVGRGETELEFHNVLMPSGTRSVSE